MTLSGHTLGRAERLKSRDRIERLFAGGKGGLVYPLRYIIFEEETASLKHHGREGAPVSLLVSVPKRHHKRAVRRNLLKRRIREAYRLYKTPLLEAQALREGKVLSLGLLYVAKEPSDYQQIEDAVRTIIRKVAQRG